MRRFGALCAIAFQPCVCSMSEFLSRFARTIASSPCRPADPLRPAINLPYYRLTKMRFAYKNTKNTMRREGIITANCANWAND